MVKGPSLEDEGMTNYKQQVNIASYRRPVIPGVVIIIISCLRPRQAGGDAWFWNYGEV